MPRKPRTKSELGIYHVIIRGINKQEIFYDEQDKKKFLKEIKRTKEKFEYELLAFCIMPNHVHFIIRDLKENLSKVMQSLLISYSSYFNQKYERIGHLFQNRYIAKNIETIEYLLKAQRYIHQNPIKAGIGNTDNYDWSSYKEYVIKNKIADTEFVLSQFKGDRNKQVEQFEQYTKEDEEKLEDNEILEFELRPMLTDEEAIKLISEKVKISNLMSIQKYNNEEKIKIVKEIKKIKGINNVQLVRILGLNKRLIERAR